MTSDAREQALPSAPAAGRAGGALPPCLGGMSRQPAHRFWLLGALALVAAAVAWVALVVWGGSTEMRRGLLTGGAPLMSGDSHAGHGGAHASMLGVSMAGKDPFTAGYAAMFLWMWTVMVVAMMVPVIVPSVRSFLSQDASGARSAGPTFLLAVVGLWVALGAAVLAALAGLHAVLPDPTRPAVTVGAAILLLAGLFQFTRRKERALCHVRGPFCAGGGGPWKAGLEHGRLCVASCGPYMVAVALIGMMSLFWMAVFTVVMLAEQLTELLAARGQVVARAIGSVVVVVAIGLLLAPGPLPLLA